MIAMFVGVVGLMLLAMLKAASLIAVAIVIVGIPAWLVMRLIRVMRGPRAKRFLPALVVVFALGGTAISQAQVICTIPCPVWDYTAILRTIVLNEIKEEIDGLEQEKAEKLYKMAWRLQQFVSMAHLFIHPDNRPEWRIFDWFSDAVLVAKPFHHALSYGDANGDGLTEVSLPHPNPADVLGRLSPESAATLRHRMAIIDLQTSTLVRATDETGLFRFHGRATQAAVDDIQHDILKDDNVESATKVLDTIAAARLLHLRDRAVYMKLRSSEVEFALIENIAEREAAAAAMESFIHRKKDAGRTANALVSGADVLTGWQQP